MSFDDLRELLDEQTLKLPIGGVVYTIEACNAEEWLWLNAESRRIQALINSGQMGADAEGDNPEVFARRCLGRTFDEMVKDGVSGKELQIAALTAFFWHLGNEAFAEAVWANGGKALSSGPEMKKALAPNRAARRATSSPSRTSRAIAASPKAKTTRASSRRSA